MIDRARLDKEIDLKNTHYCSMDEFFELYLNHRETEKRNKGTRNPYNDRLDRFDMTNTTATIGRVLLCISQLEAVAQAARDFVVDGTHSVGNLTKKLSELPKGQ